MRRAHLALKRAVHRLGPAKALENARELVEWLEETPAYRALTKPRGRTVKGRRPLRDEVLFVDPGAHAPRVLHLRRGSTGLDVPVTPSDWPRLNDFFVGLSRGLERREGRAIDADLFDTLASAQWLERATPTARPKAPGFTFVGHNTTLVSAGGARVLVDPYFRPASTFDLPSYQPMQPRDVGPVDAIVITHSHGDHFHLGSLLPFSRETPIFVPPVERENLFSTDCVARLTQLGFTRVEALPWWATRRVGGVEVQALPFYGEQPTGGEGVHPALWNVGATWAIRGPDFSGAFFADSGRDLRGDMRQVCRRMKPVDVLFCGVRGFRVKPIFYSFTTLDAFLVNVPLDQVTQPQQLMADAQEALEYGALLGAKHVVPCADGGAPWYWREGMGPKYAGYPGLPVDGASPYEENADADPFPERVREVRRPGHPDPLLLRPGDRWSWQTQRVTRAEPFAWPGWRVSRRARPGRQTLPQAPTSVVEPW